MAWLYDFTIINDHEVVYTNWVTQDPTEVGKGVEGISNVRPLYTAPQTQQPAEVPLKQIAEALRQHGLTLIKKANGYDVMKLGNIEAQEQAAVRQKAGLK